MEISWTGNNNWIRNISCFWNGHHISEHFQAGLFIHLLSLTRTIVIPLLSLIIVTFLTTKDFNSRSCSYFLSELLDSLSIVFFLGQLAGAFVNFCVVSGSFCAFFLTTRFSGPFLLAGCRRCEVQAGCWRDGGCDESSGKSNARFEAGDGHHGSLRRDEIHAGKCLLGMS